MYALFVIRCEWNKIPFKDVNNEKIERRIICDIRDVFLYRFQIFHIHARMSLQYLSRTSKYNFVYTNNKMMEFPQSSPRSDGAVLRRTAEITISGKLQHPMQTFIFDSVTHICKPQKTRNLIEFLRETDRTISQRISDTIHFMAQK